MFLYVYFFKIPTSNFTKTTQWCPITLISYKVKRGEKPNLKDLRGVVYDESILFFFIRGSL